MIFIDYSSHVLYAASFSVMTHLQQYPMAKNEGTALDTVRYDVQERQPFRYRMNKIKFVHTHKFEMYFYPKETV